MTTEQRIAEAFRLTALKLEDAIERGKHSGKIDAEDLLQTLLSIADDLDPPVLNAVAPEAACPNCDERDADKLVWQEDETVRCDACGTTYEPEL
jgi:hypothetical protein